AVNTARQDVEDGHQDVGYDAQDRADERHEDGEQIEHRWGQYPPVHRSYHVWVYVLVCKVMAARGVPPVSIQDHTCQDQVDSVDYNRKLVIPYCKQGSRKRYEGHAHQECEEELVVMAHP